VVRTIDTARAANVAARAMACASATEVRRIACE
jgi:hypothetical protein